MLSFAPIFKPKLNLKQSSTESGPCSIWCRPTRTTTRFNSPSGSASGCGLATESSSPRCARPPPSPRATTTTPSINSADQYIICVKDENKVQQPRHRAYSLSHRLKLLRLSTIHQIFPEMKLERCMYSGFEDVLLINAARQFGIKIQVNPTKGLQAGS